MPQFTVELRESIGDQHPYWETHQTRIRIRADEMPYNQRDIDALVAQKAVAKIFGRRLSLHVEHQAPGSIIGDVYRPARWPGDIAMWERADVGRLSISIYR